MGDKYGIRFTSRHGNLLPESNWDNQITASRILGQVVVGESGLPNNTAGYNTWQALLATVQQMNRLGKRSVEAGLGPAFFHNHNDEFSRRYTDQGRSCPTTEVNTACKSSWQIIMERTDPRWVDAQIDIGWAVCGSAFGTPPDAAAAMAYVTAMINQFTNRIVSYHFKDMAASAITLNCGNDAQRDDRPRRHQLRADDRGGQEPLQVLLHGARPGRGRRADELQPVHEHRERDEGDARRSGADAVRLPAGLQLGRGRHAGGGQPGRGHRHQRR